MNGPFWNYYGGKWRAAPRYPPPVHSTLVEPFAGAAGYSLRYARLRVILVEKSPVLAEMWRFLIAATPADIRSIPEVEAVDELPSQVPQGARDLVGFSLNSATTHPSRRLSAGRRKLAAMGRRLEGWNAARRERLASQVLEVKHWQIIEGDYADAPDLEATWFVDPPYNNKAGSYYVEGPRGIDYPQLGAWCRTRQGQVLVCENEPADWLPFAPFATFKAGVNGTGSREVLWQGGGTPLLGGGR